MKLNRTIRMAAVVAIAAGLAAVALFRLSITRDSHVCHACKGFGKSTALRAFQHPVFHTPIRLTLSITGRECRHKWEWFTASSDGLCFNRREDWDGPIGAHPYQDELEKMLAGKNASATAGHSPNTNQPSLELWDVGNVFVQPRQTLILALWGDGRIVSRLDETGQPNLDLTLTQVPKRTPMIGQTTANNAASILRQLERAGFLKADKYSGLNFPDGPCVRLVFRNGGISNEVQHVAVDDTKYHSHMNTPELEAFSAMWDKVVPVLRSIHGEQWRPLAVEDGVVTEIPWRQKKAR